MKNFQLPNGNTELQKRPDGNMQPLAVIYIRSATKAQKDPLEARNVRMQYQACRERAMQLGAIVEAEYSDLGVSGLTRHRSGLSALLRRLKQEPKVDYVIVHRLDRLARNLPGNLAITSEITTAGAKLVSCSEQIDKSPAGVLMHEIISALGQFYSVRQASESLEGRIRKAKAGGTPAKAPLGYVNVIKLARGRVVRSVEIDPVRGPILKRAFEAFAKGEQSLTSVLKAANDAGLSAKRASKIRPSHFRQLLAHPYFKGVVRYAGHEYPGQHEPLITEETWQQIQELLASEEAA